MQIICDALLDFVPSLQFLKHEKRLWRSVTFTHPGAFLKLYKWYQIAQSIAFIKMVFQNWIKS